MKVLIVGKGGREHALAWKVSQSPRVENIYAAPGSPGIAEFAECLPDIRTDTPVSQRTELEKEIAKLRDFAQAEAIDLTIVGPEDVLAGGIVDAFRAVGLRVFGPTQAAARIESDKAFSKELMASIGVPTAKHETFSNVDSALDYLHSQGAPIVVKATGLAAGKGVVVCATLDEGEKAVRDILDDRVHGEAGTAVVIEEFMSGEEVSLFSICDGRSFVSLVPAQDHKAIGEGDTGPNTGGMGAYAPAPVMTAEMTARVETEIVEPVLKEMGRRGWPFAGVLYTGLMITEQGPRVVEFNCRFGDPEIQVVLPLLDSDFLDLCEAAADGDVTRAQITCADDRVAVCVVMASAGYPGSYDTGKPITGVAATAASEDTLVFHSGTAREGEQLVTAGGRVLAVTCVNADIEAAVNGVYQAVEGIAFDGAYLRQDIAHRALNRLSDAR